ncbi:MAG: hypothetical protein WDZ83_14360 [Rhizobiaceae bacterium]
MNEFGEAFDQTHRERVLRYLAMRNLQLFDPFDGGANPDDVFFAPSLELFRMQASVFAGAARPNGERFVVYPMFVEDARANAFACELDGVHLCAINAGMATIAYELAAFTFSRKDTFLDIGDAGGENAPPLPAGSLLGYWIWDQIAANLQPETPAGVELLPKNRRRGGLAWCLSHLLLRFTWFHEMFHGLNGHCGLLRSFGSTPELHEMPGTAEVSLVRRVEGKTGDTGASRLFHAFEMDADQSALWAMIHLQRSNAEALMPLDNEPLSIRLRLVIVASVLMAYLFEQVAKRDHTHLSETHPRAGMRLHRLVGSLFSDSGQAVPEVQSLIPVVLEDIRSLERNFPGMITADQLADELSGQFVPDELAAVENEIDRMRGLAAAFAYRPGESGL